MKLFILGDTIFNAEQIRVITRDGDNVNVIFSGDTKMEINDPNGTFWEMFKAETSPVPGFEKFSTSTSEGKPFRSFVADEQS